jgi:hypothetical protein
MRAVTTLPEPEPGDYHLKPQDKTLVPNNSTSLGSADLTASDHKSTVVIPSSTSKPVEPLDPFDPAGFRISQDFGANLGVKKHLTTVPKRKPDKASFVRTHPDPAFTLSTYVIELKEDQELYLVAPVLWPELASESTFTPKMLVTSVNRQGVLYLWPIRLPGPDGKIDSWSRSALEAAEIARTTWVRVQANMSLGAYEVVSSSLTAQPVFPDLSMAEILKIAFKDFYITDLDHPVLRKLRGEL